MIYKTLLEEFVELYGTHPIYCPHCTRIARSHDELEASDPDLMGIVMYRCPACGELDLVTLTDGSIADLINEQMIREWENVNGY